MKTAIATEATNNKKIQTAFNAPAEPLSQEKPSSLEIAKNLLSLEAAGGAKKHTPQELCDIASHHRASGVVQLFNTNYEPVWLFRPQGSDNAGNIRGASYYAGFQVRKDNSAYSETVNYNLEQLYYALEAMHLTYEDRSLLKKVISTHPPLEKVIEAYHEAGLVDARGNDVPVKYTPYMNNLSMMRELIEGAAPVAAVS